MFATALCALLVPPADAALTVGSAAGATARSATAAKRRAAPVAHPIYPSKPRVAAATRFLSRRAGRKSFAVVDDRGSLAGYHEHGRFHSASVVKSMLLVAYLRRLAAEHRGLDATSKGLMYPMIHSSDNDAASAILAIVGEKALDRVARDAHMADYEPAGATWGSPRSPPPTLRASSTARTR